MNSAVLDSVHTNCLLNLARQLKKYVICTHIFSYTFREILPTTHKNLTQLRIMIFIPIRFLGSPLSLVPFFSTFFLKIYFCFRPIGVLSWVSGPPERNYSYELPCGCWELNLGPLEEQPVLLTTEPSLQSPKKRNSLTELEELGKHGLCI